MAKLNKQLAKQADEKAEDWKGSFDVLPPGLYLAKLKEVDATRTGPSGPYWAWTFETVEAPNQPAGRYLWVNTSLSEKAIGQLGKVFQAFGATTNTDTDDLIGQVICVQVTIGTINAGNRAGEKRNEVSGFMSSDAHPDFDETEFAAEGASASPGDF